MLAFMMGIIIIIVSFMFCYSQGDDFSLKSYEKILAQKISKLT